MTNAWKSEYTYDGKLRRRITKEFTWNGSSWSQTNETHYVYDGNVVVQEQDANDHALVSYTRGKDLSGSLQGAGGIGGLLARTDNSQALYISMIARRGYPPPPAYTTTAHAYYHADGNGNVTLLINASQMIVAKYLYDSFGNTLAQSGLLADANTYRFSSKEWNNSAGIYYYMCRFYDSNLQRWINKDLLAERGFQTLLKHQKTTVSNVNPNIQEYAECMETPNLYEFIGNDPLNYTDPAGLLALGPGGVGGNGKKAKCDCASKGGTMGSYSDCVKQNPIQCANGLLDDYNKKYVPSPLEIPLKITGFEWLWFLEKCNRQTCCVNGAPASGPSEGLFD